MRREDSNIPIACTLNDTDFRERRAFARQRLLPKIDKSARLENGLVIFVHPDSGIKDDLDIFVRLEQQCCRFLSFTILSDCDDPLNPVGLKIDGPAEATATINMFAEVISSHLESKLPSIKGISGCGCRELNETAPTGSISKKWLVRIRRTSWSGVFVGGLLLLACELPMLLAALGLGALSAGAIALQPSSNVEIAALSVAVIGVLALFVFRRTRS